MERTNGTSVATPVIDEMESANGNGPRPYRREFRSGDLASVEEGLVGREYATAIARARASFGKVEKDAQNRFDHYRYATLKSVLEAVGPALRAGGFEIVQAPISLPGWAGATTEIAHESGQYRAVSILLPVTARGRKEEVGKEPTARDHGAAISYARRYGLLGILGLSADEEAEEPVAAPARSASAGTEPAAESQAASVREEESGGMVVSVVKTDYRQGGSGEKSWTKYGLLVRDHRNGEEFWISTFDQMLADRLTSAGTAAVEIETTTKGGKTYRNLKQVLAAPAQPTRTENGREEGDSDEDVPF